MQLAVVSCDGDSSSDEPNDFSTQIYGIWKLSEESLYKDGVKTETTVWEKENGVCRDYLEICSTGNVTIYNIVNNEVRQYERTYTYKNNILSINDYKNFEVVSIISSELVLREYKGSKDNYWEFLFKKASKVGE